MVSPGTVANHTQCLWNERSLCFFSVVSASRVGRGQSWVEIKLYSIVLCCRICCSAGLSLTVVLVHTA